MRAWVVLALGGALFGCGGEGRATPGDAGPGAGRDGRALDGGDAAAPPWAGCRGVVLEADGLLELDLAAVALEGVVTIDGAPIGEGDRGSLRFEPNERANEAATVTIARDGASRYEGTLVPGTYDVSYVPGYECAALHAPCTTTPILRGVRIVEDGVLDVDLHASSATLIAIEGEVTLDGKVLPDEGSDRGRVTFVERTTGASATVPLETDGALRYEVRLAPGEYEVAYQPATIDCARGLAMPCTPGTAIDRVAIRQDGVLDVDLRVVRVEGELLVDGAHAPGEADDRGQIALTDAEGDVVARTDSLGTSGPARYEARVWPGAYGLALIANAQLCQGDEAPTMPCLGGPLLDRVSLDRDGVVDLDVHPVTVRGAITLDGAALPNAEIDRGSIELVRGDERVTVAYLGTSGRGQYVVRATPGRYAFHYRVASSECLARLSPMPCVSGLVAEVDVMQSGVVDVDVPAVHVSGEIFRNGAPLDDDGASPRLEFEGRNGSTATVVGTAGQYDVVLLRETYEVAYEPEYACDATLGELPCTAIELGVITPRDESVLDVDIPAIRVEGEVTVDGAAMGDEAFERGTLTFRVGDHSVSTRSFGTSGPARYAITLAPGEHEIVLAPGGCGRALPCLPAPLGRHRLMADGVLDLDAASVRIDVQLTLDGASWPRDAANGALVFATIDERGEERGSARIPIDDDELEVVLTPGRYVVRHDSETTCDGVAPSIPCADQTLLGCER